MKKSFIILLALLCWSSIVSAQENYNRLRKKYINLGFVDQDFDPSPYFGLNQTLKSNFGGSFTVGRTYYLHRKPIAGILRIGIDATWFDLNYTNYKLEYRLEEKTYEEEAETSNFHQAELAMQVGPSITVNPIGKLNLYAYFRFAPSFSALYDDDTFMGNYASYFVTGGCISYGVIGVGIESRRGDCKFKTFGSDDTEEGESDLLMEKSKFNGMRIYLSFRF